MKILLRILIGAVGLLAAAYFVPGIEVTSIYIAIIAAMIHGVLNMVVRPILFVLTLPITIVTLGLFTFVINAGLFWFVSTFIEGFYVSGFWAALFGSLVTSIVSTIGNKTLK